MKKLILISILCYFLQGSVFGQSFMVDAYMPSKNVRSGFGARYTMFFNVTPKFEVGGLGRFNILNIQQTGEFGLSGNTEAMQEIALGVGAKYYLVNDIYHQDRFYINPNIELNTLHKDTGIDFSGVLGYTRDLNSMFNFTVEAGLRHKTIKYQSDYASNGRLHAFIGVGLGITMPAGSFHAIFNKNKVADEDAKELID